MAFSAPSCKKPTAQEVCDRKRISVKKLCIFVVIAPLLIPSASGKVASPPHRLVQAQNQFALALFQSLRQQAGNLFVSPYSISTSIGMVFAGAKGQAAAQIAKLLHLDLLGTTGSPNALKARYLNAVLRETHDLSHPAAGFNLQAANALWGSTNFHFNRAFISTIKTDFAGSLKPIDFTNPAIAANRIDHWVAQRTNNKIEGLIQPGDIRPKTPLILTNAIYFKARWEQPFDYEATYQKPPFRVSPTKHVTVDMMNQIETFPLAIRHGVKILSLPYKGGASMIIILPDNPYGLRAVQARLTTARLNDWLNHSVNTRVFLTLPKFKTSSTTFLQSPLASMGMTRVFNPSQADLAGIAPQTRPRLYIGDMIHKAFIKIDETGTEAAAATATVSVGEAGISDGPPPPNPIPFVADHPFIYLIRDNNSGLILFMGRLANPALN